MPIEYAGEEFEEFIVALPENVHFPAQAMHEL